VVGVDDNDIYSHAHSGKELNSSDGQGLNFEVYVSKSQAWLLDFWNNKFLRSGGRRKKNDDFDTVDT
jgi:hypothetical protein